MGDLQARREASSRVSTALDSLDDGEMRAAVLRQGTTTRDEWGTSHHRAEIEGLPVFVKRIPLTGVEHSNPLSTRNRFRLPSYYSYGVGSAGFGAYRELATHQKTTNWVLEGAIDSFPLLHHARVMARTPAPTADPGFDLDDYVQKWNHSSAVAGYMRARADARHEVWLVLERFPHTLAAWLPTNQRGVGPVIEDLRRTIAFLRSRGIVHFDAHLANVVGDGERWYLTDFGLALDPGFDLTDRERTFLAGHSHYDAGAAIASIGSVVLGMFRALGPADRARLAGKYGVPPDAATHRILRALLDRLDTVHEDGDLPLDAHFVRTLLHHRAVIIFMTTFLGELQGNPRKNTKYDDDALKRLLDAAGPLS